MSTLDALASKYGTDKGSAWARGLYGKDYARLYERYFAPWRDEEITLVEIGVQTGASLRMWEEYFSRARIFGIDINPACARHASERSTVLIGDQTDRGFLQEVTAATGPIHVVIDDGGHTMEQHRVSLEELWPVIEPGGMYFVEDLHTAYIGRYGGGLGKESSTIEHLKTLVDALNEKAESEVPLPGLDEVHFSKSLAVLVRR
jgi:hypothetical protein